MSRISRLPAVVLLLAGGVIHFELWRSGYRGIPYIGPLFIANMAVSGVLGGALVVRDDARLTIGGILFAVGSLTALVLSRTVGLLGFTERAWTDQAVRATTAELGAIVGLFVILVAGQQRRALIPARVRSDQSRPAPGVEG